MAQAHALGPPQLATATSYLPDQPERPLIPAMRKIQIPLSWRPTYESASAHTGSPSPAFASCVGHEPEYSIARRLHAHDRSDTAHTASQYVLVLHILMLSKREYEVTLSAIARVPDSHSASRWN